MLRPTRHATRRTQTPRCAKTLAWGPVLTGQPTRGRLPTQLIPGSGTDLRLTTRPLARLSSEMDYAVQPLIFYAADERPVPDLPRSATYGLVQARDWYARELSGRTFDIDEPVVFVSALMRRTWENRHRSDGSVGHVPMWVDHVRQAIAANAIRNDGTRIYYYVTVARGAGGLALTMPYFGCGAYMSGDDTERLLAGLPQAAGLMAHELGHCLGHPGQSLVNINWSSRNVMSSGHRQFPDCFLTDGQRAVLAPSPFLREM